MLKRKMNVLVRNDLVDILRPYYGDATESTAIGLFVTEAFNLMNRCVAGMLHKFKESEVHSLQEIVANWEMNFSDFDPRYSLVTKAEEYFKILHQQEPDAVLMKKIGDMSNFECWCLCRLLKNCQTTEEHPLKKAMFFLEENGK